MAEQIGFGATIVGATTGAMGNITKVGLPEYTCETIDFTDLASAGKVAEKFAGKLDAGEIEVTSNFDKTASPPDYANVGQANEEWVITYSDGSTETFQGFMSKCGGGELTMDGLVEVNYSIVISGTVVFVAGT